MYIHTHTHTHTCIQGSIYVYTNAYICAYTYIYTYICTHIYIYLHNSCVRRLCDRAAASLPWKLLRTYFESCANIVQAVVSARPPAPSSSRPPSCWPVARPVRSRNPSKSTLAHDAAAAGVFHRHHPIIRVGAGLIQFVYGSHSQMAAGPHPRQKSFLAAIFAAFSLS